jgi:hypothetical protein
MERTEAAVGHATAVLVFGRAEQQKAVTTVISTNVNDSSGRTRLGFRGGQFSNRAKNHIRTIILPIIDRIMDSLGLPHKNYDISLANIGAASSHDISINVSGYSADVAVFLSLLSASLRLPLPESIMATGHISSVGGDIAAVKALPVKIKAARDNSAIQLFICPNIEGDFSLKVLTPREQEQSIAAIMAAKKNLRIKMVNDIGELIPLLFTEEDIVRAGLQVGFYSISGTFEGSDAVSRLLLYFCTDNSKRFWDALTSLFLSGTSDQAKELLRLFTQHHIRQQRYPRHIGRTLAQIMYSLPPAIRRSTIQYPLLDTGLCIRLVQFAKAQDHEDVYLLFEVNRGRPAVENTVCSTTQAKSFEPSDTDCAAFDIVVSRINERAFAEKYGSGIDAARGTYLLHKATVKSSDEFFQIISGFYMQLARQCSITDEGIDYDNNRARAIELLNETYQQEGGIQRALADAKSGVNGGMRTILDKLTDRYKQEMFVHYRRKALIEAIDVQNWDEIITFMRGALKRLAPVLPPELREMPPERLARNYEQVVQAYLQSYDQIQRTLQTL